jgi:hypothetical protein
MKCVVGNGEYAEGSYAVVVGSSEGSGVPKGTGALWMTVSHTHPGVPNQPGYRNPSHVDLHWAKDDAEQMLEKTTGGTRKRVEFQTPEGNWESVRYGYDIDKKKYYVEVSRGEPRYFDQLKDPEVNQIDFNRYEELLEKGLHKERIELMKSQNSEETYLGWYARQFVFDE